MPRTAGDQPAGRLQQDPLIEGLVPDPGQLEPLTLLFGYLGKSSREGYWRLYLNVRLSEYVEFSESDVHHAQPLSPEESSLGGTRVWVKQGTRLQHTRVDSREVQAEFLQGDIATRFMRSAAPSAGAGLARAAGVRARCATAAYYCDPLSEEVCRTEFIPPYELTINLHIPACRSEAYGGCGGGGGGGFTDFGPLCDTGAFVCGYSVGCTPGRPECGG
jgi:hypothetical protein